MASIIDDSTKYISGIGSFPVPVMVVFGPGRGGLCAPVSQGPGVQASFRTFINLPRVGQLGIVTIGLFAGPFVSERGMGLA